MNVEKIREDFPILNIKVHNRPLVYLDNGATAQMPLPVMAAVEEQYKNYQANIHRGIHFLSEASTARVEKVREKTAEFIGAKESCEIIFTSGTTQSINMAARSFADAFVGAGDVVVTTEMEHHSNFLPWQEAAKRSGAIFKVAHMDEAGNLDLEELQEILKLSPKILAVTMVSNVTGAINPVKEIIEMSHRAGCAVLLDAAQAAKTEKIDVAELDCDFLCFSGHKMLAPGGVGVLYGKRSYLEKMQPVLYGGGMVDKVGEDESTYGEIPFKFEAGTANIAGIIGLGSAIDYIESVGREELAKYEKDLTDYTLQRLSEIERVKIVGNPKNRVGAVSFTIEGVHNFDAAKLLDQLGIAVRSGHHCAQPLLRHFGLEGAIRVTPAFYNTKEEIDTLIAGLNRILAIMQ